MKRFLSRRTPGFGKILFVESGSRSVSENWIDRIRGRYPDAAIDLITCFEGAPSTFDSAHGSIVLVHNYRTQESRDRLIQELRLKNYDMIGIVCSAEPIMTRWKWFIAWKVPVKVFIVNENADWFWLDRGNLSTIKTFVSFRAGMSGSGALRQPLRLLFFPFILSYLAAYAAYIHLRRKVLT